LDPLLDGSSSLIFIVSGKPSKEVKMKRILITLAGFIMMGAIFPYALLAEEEKALTGSITLAQALQLSLLQNPQLQAYSYEIRAREAQALQVGMVSNPVLNVQVENASGSLNGFNQSETTIQLSQLVELGDKRNLRRNSASLSKELAGWDYEVKRLEVFTQVSQAFNHVLKAQQKVSLASERLQLARKFLTTVSERIKAGKVAAIEKIKTEVALANMRIEGERAKMELENSRRKLSILWGEPKPEFDSAQGDFFSVHEKTLPKIESLSSNPVLSKRSTAMDHRQAELNVEISKAIPDLTLSGGYRRLEQTRDNALVFGLTVPLNWFNRNQGGVAKARHRLSRAQEEKKAEALKIKEALLQAYSEVSFSYAKVIAIKTEILPGAQRTFDAISEGYSFGKFALLDVLDSQKILFKFQNQYLNALANYHNAVSTVERLTGVIPPALNQALENGGNRP
jgi:outer membrane protein, heavy metal efflux system